MSPSIAEEIGARAQNLAKVEARSDFFKLCRLLLKHGSIYEARNHAKSEHARERVVDILTKASVVGGGIDSWSSISDYQNIQRAFQESLRTLSVFDAALANGMIRAPLRSRGFSVTTGITGGVVGERAFKPISSLVLAQQLLEPRKASSIVVISKELADFSGAAQLFGDELTRGVVSATDTTFLAALIAATTPSASGGSTLAAAIADFDTLLSAVTTSASSKLFYVASPSNIKSLVVKASSGGAPVFPNLGINGGEIFNGVTAIASDSIAINSAVLFDATQIVGNADAVVPGRSEQGTLQLESSPDSPPTSATSLLSLWQEDMLALRVERYFGFTILRASAVASLSGVSY
jgi:Phage capsid family